MTPAIKSAKKAKIFYKIHQYEHDASNTSYGLEAAQKLALAPEQVFKTLLLSLDENTLAVAVLPVSSMLNMKALAKAFGAKKTIMASAAAVEKSTGYVLGGVSPLAQKKALPTVIDSSAVHFETIFVSAGRRGLEIELKPQDLAVLSHAKFFEITR